MKALLFDGRVARVAGDRPRPERRSSEARVALRLAGVCNTDLEIARGYMGFCGVLGHEFVGTVTETDEPSLAGARVVGRINCGCGSCERCAAGLENHCPARTVLGILGRDGAFAEELVLPSRNLLPVPAGVPDAVAVFAEPLAAACRILEQVDVAKAGRVLVIGDGKLGLLCALVAALHATEVVVQGRHPGRVARLLDLANVREAAETRDRFPLVIDATGSEAGLSAALARVAPLGTIVLKTTCHAEHRLDLAPAVIDEVTIIGSRCGPLDVALELLARGRIDPTPLIHGRFPLSRAEDALAAAAQRGALKVLISGDESA